MRQLRVTRRSRVRRDDVRPTEEPLRGRSAPRDEEDCEAVLHRIDEVLSQV